MTARYYLSLGVPFEPSDWHADVPALAAAHRRVRAALERIVLERPGCQDVRVSGGLCIAGAEVTVFDLPLEDDEEARQVLGLLALEVDAADGSSVGRQVPTPTGWKSERVATIGA